jgi:hypothetical protein
MPMRLSRISRQFTDRNQSTTGLSPVNYVDTDFGGHLDYINLFAGAPAGDWEVESVVN